MLAKPSCSSHDSERVPITRSNTKWPPYGFKIDLSHSSPFEVNTGVTNHMNEESVSNYNTTFINVITTCVYLLFHAKMAAVSKSTHSDFLKLQGLSVKGQYVNMSTHIRHIRGSLTK